MGKTAAFTKARKVDARRKYEQRAQRSKVERQKRLGADQEERRVQVVHVSRPLPTKADEELLVGQFAQACRLPGPSADLCALMREYAGGDAADTTNNNNNTSVGKKRPRSAEVNLIALDRLATIFLATERTPVNEEEMEEDDDPETVLHDALQDDCGRRVISTLIASLTTAESSHAATVMKTVLEQYEEDDRLATHHIACRIMSSLAQHGSDEIRRGVLDVLRQRATSFEALREVLTNRHTCVTVEMLLRYFPDPTRQWLVEALDLTHPTSTTSPDAPTRADLLALLNDPVAGQLVPQLITPATRAIFLARLDLSELLGTKRGVRLLRELLSVEDGESEAAASMLTTMLAQPALRLGRMCVSRRDNFVVQQLMALVPHTGPKAADFVRQMQHIISAEVEALDSLLEHPIGVHVLVALVEASMQTSDKAVVESVAATLLHRRNLDAMLISRHGSLVVRRLMPLIARKDSKMGQLLHTTMEQSFSSLVNDAMGNLVVQAYLRALGPAGASALARKLAKNSHELLAYCTSPAGAHVVGTLLEVIDPPTLTALCQVLKPHAMRLAIHLNGRFIIEKILPTSRELRDELVRQFLLLAYERGTQHVLCSLVANLDPRGRQHVIAQYIRPHLKELATHQFGSIGLQKLMQAESEIHDAVKAALAEQPTLRNELAQNFFGKFVVQIATH